MSKFLTQTFFIGLSILVSQANAATVSVDVSGQVTSSSIPALPVGEPISGRITYDQSVVPAVGDFDFSVVNDLNGALTLMLAGQTFEHIDDPFAPGFPTVGFSDGLVTGMDFATHPFDAYGLTNIVLGTNTVGGTTTAQFFIREFITDLAEGIFSFSAPALIVAIDIKPGSDPNSINPGAGGFLGVAILTTGIADGDAVDFDATQVNGASVTFGPDGAGIARVAKVKDVDNDGDADLILHFKMADTGIECGDTGATLSGETSSGDAIQSEDSLITRCK